MRNDSWPPYAVQFVNELVASVRRDFPGRDLVPRAGAASTESAGQLIWALKVCIGQQRRYRPRSPTVRCSTDSGHIAAPPRTGFWGQQRKSICGRTSFYFSIARALTTSLVHFRNSFATGLRSRFFNVTKAIGLRVSGKSIGSALSDPR